MHLAFLVIMSESCVRYFSFIRELRTHMPHIVIVVFCAVFCENVSVSCNAYLYITALHKKVDPPRIHMKRRSQHARNEVPSSCKNHAAFDFVALHSSMSHPRVQPHPQLASLGPSLVATTHFSVHTIFYTPCPRADYGWS